MVKPQTTKDAEALADEIMSLGYDLHEYASPNAAKKSIDLILSALTAVEQRGFERGVNDTIEIASKHLISSHMSSEIDGYQAAATVRELMPDQRGKADVVPSGDAEDLARSLSQYDTFGNLRTFALEKIQSAFAAVAAAARAEGERIGAERAAVMVETQKFQSDFDLSWSNGDVLMAQKIRAALPTPLTERSVPDGWQLVPIKATYQMVLAWMRATPNRDDITDQDACNAEWTAMLAAAPPAPMGERAQQWQPIHTAPQDCSDFLLYSEGYGVNIAHYELADCEFYSGEDYIPTPSDTAKWMPLPAAPSPAKPEDV